MAVTVPMSLEWGVSSARPGASRDEARWWIFQPVMTIIDMY
jgi:hypothetical protein